MASLQKYSTGGQTYWRIVESYRDNGRPKIRVIKHLGTVANILAVVEGQERDLRVRSTSHGNVLSLLAIAEELQVASEINKELASRNLAGVPMSKGITPGQTCVLIAIGRACHPTSKMGWAGWARTTSLPETQRLSLNALTSQFFWDQMDLIPTDALPAIEARLAGRAVKQRADPLDLLLYDATNFYTFIASENDRCDLPQRGKNKQKRADLRQIGLALLVSRQNKLPLWHQIYRGNQTDVSLFPDVLTCLRARIAELASDVSAVTVVYDRGNNASKANQTLVDNSDFHYVAALTPTNHRKLVSEANDAFEQVEIRPKESIPAWRAKRTIWGAERTVVVHVSERLRAGQIRGLWQHLDKRSKRLRELSDILLSPTARRRDQETLQNQVTRLCAGQHISTVLKTSLQEQEPGRFSLNWWLDEQAYDELINCHFGRRILITDQHDWSTAQIVLAYRGQSDVEDTFRTMKDPFHLAFRPQHHWTDQKIEVHGFCCVLAYLLVRLLHTRVVEATSFRGSIRSLMDLLGQVRRATVLEKTPGKPGRPCVRIVLDYPDDPVFNEVVKALAITP